MTLRPWFDGFEGKLKLPISPPPTNNDRVVRHDHADIAATDRLIRRISSQYVVEKNGVQRLSSLAFKGSSDGSGMSVDIEKLIIEMGNDVVNFTSSSHFIGSVVFVAGPVRDEGFAVGYDPIDPDNMAHGEIWDPQTKAESRKLAALANWLVEIPGVEIV
jgi:hypothetical protein